MTEQIPKKVIDVVNAVTKSGAMDVLLRYGLINPQAPTYRDMYLKYLAYLEQGFSKKQAVSAVADLFKYEDVRTVYRAKAIMETEVID